MSKRTISDEIGWQIVKAFTTEMPQPSQKQLAARFGVSRNAIQRYLAKHLTESATAPLRGTSDVLLTAARANSAFLGTIP